MEQSLVNFKRDLNELENITEIQKVILAERLEEIERSIRKKIAELLGISDEVMDDYILISLYPLSRIFANNLLNLHYPYIIYTIEELKENSEKFFRVYGDKLSNAESIHTENTIKELIDSINSIDSDSIEDITKSTLTISIYDNIPSVDFGINLVLLALIKKDNILLGKTYGRLSDEDYYEIRQSLIDEKLIFKKLYKQCDYCHRKGYGYINEDEAIWTCSFCRETENL